MTHMKTTLELPDDLLIEAKSVAARRRTTLKALIEHALRREIQPATPESTLGSNLIEVGSDGIACLKSRGAVVTSEFIRQLMDEEGV
jgi:hypothetical protein